MTNKQLTAAELALLDSEINDWRFQSRNPLDRDDSGYAVTTHTRGLRADLNGITGTLRMNSDREYSLVVDKDILTQVSAYVDYHGNVSGNPIAQAALRKLLDHLGNA